MNAFDNPRACEHEQVVAATQLTVPAFKLISTKIGLSETFTLYHSTHCSIENEYSFAVDSHNSH